jgi:hypothetical protein
MTRKKGKRPNIDFTPWLFAKINKDKAVSQKTGKDPFSVIPVSFGAKYLQ